MLCQNKLVYFNPFKPLSLLLQYRVFAIYHPLSLFFSLSLSLLPLSSFFLSLWITKPLSPSLAFLFESPSCYHQASAVYWSIRASAMGLSNAKCKVHLAYRPRIHSATRWLKRGEAKCFWNSTTVPSHMWDGTIRLCQNNLVYFNPFKPLSLLL